MSKFCCCSAQQSLPKIEEEASGSVGSAAMTGGQTDRLAEVQKERDALEKALAEYVNRCSRLESQIKGVKRRSVEIPSFISNISTKEEFIQAVQNIESTLSDLHGGNHELRNRCRLLRGLSSINNDCLEQTSDGISATAHDVAILLHSGPTTSFHNPQIVQEYEDELAALHLQLKQKDERIRQLEQQAEAGVAQQQEQCKIQQTSNSSMLEENSFHAELKTFEPTNKLQAKISALLTEIGDDKAAEQMLREAEADLLQLSARINPGLTGSLVSLHEATAYAMNDIESSYSRLQQMKSFLMTMFDRLKSSAGLFEEILEAIGDHSDLATRIKNFSLELSIGMQPPRDLLDVINDMEKSFGVMKESLRQINNSVLMQSSFALDMSKGASFGQTGGAVPRVFDRISEEGMKSEQGKKTNEETLLNLINEKEQQCKELEAQCNMVINANNELKASIERLTIELKAASNEISTKDYRIAELKEELDIRIANYNKLLTDPSVEEKLLAAQSKVDKIATEMKEEMEGAKRREQMLESARKELQSEFDIQREQIISLTSELTQLKDESEQLQKELQGKDEQKDRQRECLEQMQEKHRATAKMCKELAEEIESIRALYEKTKTELEVKQRETETAVRQSEEAEQRMELLQQAETELHRLQTAHRQLKQAVICSVFEDRPLAEATVINKAVPECGDEELARKLDDARATRLELMEMLSEARRQLDMKTESSTHPVNSRCPSATSTTPSTAASHSPLFPPTLVTQSACATAPFHNIADENRPVVQAVKNTKTPFPPQPFLYEATNRMNNVVQEVKEFAKECSKLEQGTILAVSYLTIRKDFLINSIFKISHRK
ncbi:hypothetical protein WR25_17143 [Diploscapter pachys]|uniref:Uncharacterized protein n=1 Tax=Diploscapter pachys TaxID=2018661 RepID=A0A2A2JGQ5_9BILA|nr:hypothetical protein WR25_17143 [Diploscapter pachys]